MKNQSNKTDIFQEITNNIIESLESESGIWQRPWALSLPQRSNVQYYQGINILILLAKATKEGYQSSQWLTFKQAKELGGIVKKGAKSTKIFYCSSLTIKDKEAKDEEESKEIFFRKQYSVFNIDQIENLPDEFYQTQKTDINQDIKIHDEIDQLIKNHNVELISKDQNSSYFSCKSDLINMPNISKFKDNNSYYATLLHELSHWTGGEKRLNREYLKSYHTNQESRAKEELVAEISSMFLSSYFNITAPKENHISYIKSWIQILKKDKKAIFTASAQAQKIFNYLIKNDSN